MPLFGQLSLAAAADYPVSDPLTLQEVVANARIHRTEIAAAQARTQAAREKAIVVSALEDPMLMPAVDHYPFRKMDSMPGERRGDGFDWNITVEQRFPLSRVRSQRRQGAEAEARRLDAETERTSLDVELQAIEAFLMLNERRKMLAVIRRQITLAEQMTDVASTRFATANAGQNDVLRAEVEVARLRGRFKAITAEERGMQAMLNTNMGRRVDAPIPALALPALDQLPPPQVIVAQSARTSRPELRMGVAEIAQTEAEVEIMRSMYRPMALVRLGPASTMAEGDGLMLMFGISIPIWRDKLRAGVAEARAMERMARADFTAMQRMVESEAVVAREQVMAARETFIALRDEVVPRSGLALEPALAAYATGSATLVTVIEAAQTQWYAEAELVMAETRLGLAWANMARAIGAAWGERP